MKRARFLVLTAAAMLAATTGTATIARADTATSLVLKTRQFDRSSAGEYDGLLRLQIRPDGAISGTFMNTEGNIATVWGGLKGTAIWLDLAADSPSLRRYFTGTLIDGKLEASAPHGLDTWTLEGTPART